MKGFLLQDVILSDNLTWKIKSPDVLMFNPPGVSIYLSLCLKGKSSVNGNVMLNDRKASAIFHSPMVEFLIIFNLRH